MEDIEIDIIDDFEIFQTIRNTWESIYNADHQARFFSSWIWLSGVLKRYDQFHESWFILAAKSRSRGSEYVAFFPLYLTALENPDGSFHSELVMAGVADADHVGFICLPEYEIAVSSAFAAFLQQEEWWTFELDNIATIEGRISLILKEFLTEGFELKERCYVSDLDHIDNNIVPYIDLPGTWEQYLQTVVSSNTRHKIRRFFRKIEDSSEFHLTYANADNFEDHLEVLLELWRSNWESRKGADQCQKILDKIGHTLRHCFEHQALSLSALWQGEKPLGAIANLLDWSHKTVLFLLGGRDDTVKDLAPGIILHADAIRDAIQKGFQVYDFLLGNEAYKFSFGAKERRIKIVAIERKHLLNPIQPLNVRLIPKALQIAASYQQTNQLSQAEQAYRQILRVQPQYPEALYNLGVVMHHQGDYPTAEECFRSLLQLQPNDVRAWFSLGNLYQIQEQLLEAEKVYRQALMLQPQSSNVAFALYHNLGYALQQQNKWDDAIACYQTARELKPDSIEAEVIWANALYAQGTLPPEQQEHYAVINATLGNKRQQAGDLKVAIAYYQQAITMNPELAEAYYTLGRALQKQERWEDAIAAYQRAQALQPEVREIAVCLANAFYAQGTLPLDQQVHYATVNYELGDECQQVGDDTGAIECYQQAIAMNPELVEAYLALGLVLQKQKRWEDAIAAYQKVQTLQPDNLQAELGIAAVLHAQNKLSIDDQARYAALSYELGNAQRQAGDLKSAIESYRQAITLRPDLVEVRNHLRLALQDQGNVKIKVSCAKQ
ncbi:MAG: GNAT family N-acetyltransferase [Leptolyngbya sp. UWPOB_LEPTO1]|uniref:GNAT family N-acetyltransferase n=1 Tax=Leptolyngbya sp. UWPOB_LEPTO1 TaxID=2815653 RepID=UPI001AC9ADE5|nr:GNAT family N-acetyltransferase [Leptolyngbya sp. UWPOB_LEPTO1]MBN8559821.1 GNAT family N-acetyltransferase [Leptolyngbya sp. UWPOB_LEPTO1]